MSMTDVLVNFILVLVAIAFLPFALASLLILGVTVLESVRSRMSTRRMHRQLDELIREHP